MLTLGIDPGLKGGLVVLNEDGLPIAWQDMPVYTSGKKHCVSGAAIKIFVDGMQPLPFYGAAIEEQGGRPGEGRGSVLTIGINYGVLIGSMSCLNIPHRMVNAGLWKRTMRVGPTAESAVGVARLYWPQHVEQHWRGTRGAYKDGLCEAALLARYAMKVRMFNVRADGAEL